MQYASAGTAAAAATDAARAAVQQGIARGLDLTDLAGSLEQRAGLVGRYVNAWRRYCWPVNGIADIRIAPFHLLASEGRAHVDQTHLWHMQTFADLCHGDPDFLLATPARSVDMGDAEAVQQLIHWWETLTDAGGEGIVVKPLDFIASGKRGLLQPAIKCRGPEYLRIIYGPEYSRPESLHRLRERSLATKRSLALREFALGVEALERFVRREPLRRVHECVLGTISRDNKGQTTIIRQTIPATSIRLP